MCTKTIIRKNHASLSQLKGKRDKVQQNTERVTIALENQQHIWCREINSIVQDMKSDIDRIDTNHRRALFKEEKTSSINSPKSLNILMT